MDSGFSNYYLSKGVHHFPHSLINALINEKSNKQGWKIGELDGRKLIQELILFSYTLYDMQHLMYWKHFSNQWANC